MGLIQTLNDGMAAAVPDGSGVPPPALDDSGVAIYRMPIAERPDKWPAITVAIRLQVVGEVGYTLTAAVKALEKSPTVEALLALSKLSRRLYTAHGSTFVFNETEATVCLIRHGIIPSITAEQFKQEFIVFCSQTKIWVESFLEGEFLDPRLATLE